MWQSIDGLALDASEQQGRRLDADEAVPCAWVTSPAGVKVALMTLEEEEEASADV